MRATSPDRRAPCSGPGGAVSSGQHRQSGRQAVQEGLKQEVGHAYGEQGKGNLVHLSGPLRGSVGGAARRPRRVGHLVTGLSQPCFAWANQLACAMAAPFGLSAVPQPVLGCFMSLCLALAARALA